MNVGDFASVRYSTGEVFNGRITSVRAMPPGDGHETERVLFTVHDTTTSPNGAMYRSMYVHKCESLEVSSSN